MILELGRLALGLLLAVFHVRIADHMRERELQLATLCHQRGLPLPLPPAADAMRTLYFVVGCTIVLLQLTRIWMSL